jgi:hypothetical protein
MNDSSSDYSPDPLRSETILRLSHPFEGSRTQRIATAINEPSSTEDARRTFWGPFLERRRQEQDTERYDADYLESQVRSNFSRSLKSYFETIASPTIITPEGQRRAAAAAAIVVQTRIRGYSSMELGLSLEPINKVVELFDGRFEYFVAFLGMYVPLAFGASLHTNGWYVDWGTPARQLTCDVTAAPTLVAAFQASPAPAGASAPSGPTTAEKARWVWILSNTSLVVPTLVAAFYIYTILSRSHEREATIDKAYQELIRVQSELIRSAFTKIESTVPSVSSSPVPSPSSTTHP